MLASFWDMDTTIVALGGAKVGELAIRLLVASACGLLIGLERELRAKEAGVRTHFLVCIGSALFMIISVYGFLSTKDVDGIRDADQARIAAQIVTGIGFIGAGTIMVNRGSIIGLTTAAGLWVAAGIGMAIGCGMYFLGLLSTLLVLIGLELLRIFFHKSRLTSVMVFKTTNRAVISELEQGLRKRGWHVISNDVAVKSKRNPDEFRVTLTLQRHASLGDEALMNFVRQFPEITLDKVDSQN